MRNKFVATVWQKNSTGIWLTHQPNWTMNFFKFSKVVAWCRKMLRHPDAEGGAAIGMTDEFIGVKHVWNTDPLTSKESMLARLTA